MTLVEDNSETARHNVVDLDKARRLRIACARVEAARLVHGVLDDVVGVLGLHGTPEIILEWHADSDAAYELALNAVDAIMPGHSLRLLQS